MPDDLYRFDQIQPAQRSLVGDKAFYLALLQQRGHPVIPGVVMPSSRFRQFLQQIDWRSPLLADLPYSSLYVDVDQPLQLQTIAQQLRQGIQAAIVPEEWLTQLEAAIQGWQTPVLMLRPSLSLPAGTDPTVSHRTRGLLQAQVCGTSRSEIGVALKQVWSELFRAKSLLYWQRLGIQLQQVNLAVLVQPLWGAIASGEANSLANRLEVKATYGLGMALTQGEMLPDLYQIELGQPGQITQKIASKPYAYQIAPDPVPSACLERCPIAPDQQATAVLNSVQLAQLTQLTQQAIASLEIPLDLEWVLCLSSEQPQFYLTQATPQLAIALSPSSKPAAQPAVQTPSESSPLIGIAASPGVVSATAWVVSSDQRAPFEVPSGAILVASQILPEMLVGLNPIAGIVTEQGGMTSHGAILARELGIPAVVGLANATQAIRSGELLLLNGDRGWVQLGQMPEQSDKLLSRSDQPFHLSLQNADRSPMGTVRVVRSALAIPNQPATTTEPQIFVSLSQTNSLAAVADLAVAGVGLLRSELLLLEFTRHPTRWREQPQQLADQLTAKIQQFAAAFAPRPVFYRSLDWRSSDLPEPNPAIGMRGTFSYQVDPALFELELAVLRRLQQQGYDNLRLILPFVRTVEEFSFCRQRVIQAGLTQVPEFRLWIMAEVPSVLLLLPDYVKAGVQGIAIGTNDLTQLLLGADRDHPQLSRVFTPQHPAVLRAIQLLVETAKPLQIPCHLCGQPTPALVEALIEWGIDGISVEPSQVEETWRAILQRRAITIERADT